ncbi:MAG: hypothetical protein LQ349_001668 [Xanthoria aureola]|nr:MAG: hypothetical protein LQ349_001668 [Xanthoria aureola]
MKTARSVATSASLNPDTYIYKILPISTAMGSISSDDSLRVIDPPTLELRGTIGGVHDGVTCLSGFRDRLGLTAGRDGLLKCIDLRTKNTAFELSEEKKPAILSTACQEHLIASGAELTNSQAAITVWDARASKRSLLQYVESHSDDVTELCFHTSRPSILLSGSTDGLVNLYDTTVADEDDALIQVFNHGSSIAHAGFLSDHEVFALSHDEAFSIYESNRSDHVEAPIPAYALGDLRPQLQCEYVVDLVSSESTGTVLGAGSHSLHQLDVVPLHRGSEWGLDTANTLRLPGAHGEEVVRSFCFSRDGNTIFTAGEDGLIKAWRSSEDPTGTMKAEDLGSAGIKRKKQKHSDRDERARFKPY